LEIAYTTTELRDLFRFPATALAQFGANVARLLAIRFADLEALQNAAELETLGAMQCDAGGDKYLELPLAEGVVLIIKPNHPKRTMTDWANVTRVKIAAIVRRDERH